MMEYQIKRNKDGWRIEDTEGNYLSYLEYNKTAQTLYGVVEGKAVTQGNFKINWKGDGRGKISNVTWNKINIMDDYFYKNYKNK